ncbi:hypothetical protein CS022_10650 [Veronia nyctiphanis]|uniref:Uncharacterized protein n=1 Tax=Veronia nyctiphanis TaxID=1278244 RepID=A0A4Q0YQA9_9GAMM|nr:hypothetical protein [Veronia nyctiphanis]RXJ73202.1 hypothetical protein CS022_10650 [Veronia nyctiphanis]
MKNVKRYQYLGIFHGAFTVLIGLIGGIFLTFSVIGEIQIWPLATWQVVLPGDTALWRSAHTGPIINGALCIAVMLCLSILAPTDRQARHISYAMILMCWGNTLFYFFRIASVNRGLALNTERFGEGTFIDYLAFLPPYLIIPVTVYAVLYLMLIAYQNYRLS